MPPKKTVASLSRELADLQKWVRDQFNKRGESTDPNVQDLPHADPSAPSDSDGPPPAKRGRKSAPPASQSTPDNTES